MSEPRPRNPFAVRDFRLLWIGEAVSALGDQFALIALPWLALVMTGSALALGSVLALMAVPRALLMLIGGVSVDRWSPRRVMLASNAVRLVAVTLLGAVILAGQGELWMLYAFALAFGVADAFFFPAQTSIVPELVDADQLQQANGIVQGTAQATVLLGPAVAGLIIAALGGDGSTPSTAGIAVALLADAATFVVSLVTLWLIRSRPHAEKAASSVLDDIRAGLGFVLGMPGLRAMILMSLAANFLIVGPFEVGLPVIAYQRLPEGAAAFGVLLSAFGGGSLVGLALAAMLPKPRPERFAYVVIGAVSVAGLALVALPFITSTLVGAAVIAISGLALGFGNLHGMTWTQSRIPPELMGRVMSVMIMGSVGLVPVSMVIAGAAVSVSLDAMLIVAGIGMALVCIVSLLNPAVRRMGFEPTYEESAEASAAKSTATRADPAAGAGEVARLPA
jgi:Na+/melibiose symporter-like transporter